jgi:thioredoxin-related protein
MYTGDWHYNLDEAKKVAQLEHKHILLNFSGSDWCGPCIRLRKEIFESEEFKTFAASSLILVNADFPRLKKNKLSSSQQEINNAAADKYNLKGIFPYTVILDANGKVLKEWEGLPDTTPAQFIQEIQSLGDAD